MKKIIAIFKVEDAQGYWLILDCGHWLKWTDAEPPSRGDTVECPSDVDPIVEYGTQGT